MESSPACEPIKILVLYDSLTGNVEHMARLVAEGASEIQGAEVRIRKISADGAGRGRGDRGAATARRN